MRRTHSYEIMFLTQTFQKSRNYRVTKTPRPARMSLKYRIKKDLLYCPGGPSPGPGFLQIYGNLTLNVLRENLDMEILWKKTLFRITSKV